MNLSSLLPPFWFTVNNKERCESGTVRRMRGRPSARVLPGTLSDLLSLIPCPRHSCASQCCGAPSDFLQAAPAQVLPPASVSLLMLRPPVGSPRFHGSAGVNVSWNKPLANGRCGHWNAHRMIPGGRETIVLNVSTSSYSHPSSPVSPPVPGMALPSKVVTHQPGPRLSPD